MITFHNPLHQGHAPVHEFFRGERVPCFEKPARVDYVEEALRLRGHALQVPDVDCADVLAQIHAPRYLALPNSLHLSNLAPSISRSKS